MSLTSGQTARTGRAHLRGVWTALPADPVQQAGEESDSRRGLQGEVTCRYVENTLTQKSPTRVGILILKKAHANAI